MEQNTDEYSTLKNYVPWTWDILGFSIAKLTLPEGHSMSFFKMSVLDPLLNIC